MRHRPKPPSLVSMWMLDVFCCALGCVTLLWLLNTREAGEQAKRAGSALDTLARTEADLARTRAALTAEVEDLRGKLALLTADRDDTATRLTAARADLDATARKLTAADARSRELDDLLARKRKDAADLSARLDTSAAAAADLQKLLRQREAERDDLARKAKAATDLLNDADAKLKAVAKAADDAKADLSAMRKTGDELSAAKQAAQSLQKKLDESAATIIDLQGQKAKLADRVDKLQTESDTRFAGIALTGTRVVFVVDVSGSMKLVDEKTPAPGKWPAVAETVGKVMRSLPTLDRFQVVVFSRSARYLLPGGWQSYRGEGSVKAVTDALLALDPDGDTNLYEALDLTFRLRADGLDTVYLFSDGLPTSGPGLPSTAPGVSDADRSARLTRQLRDALSGSWNRGGPGRRVRINAVGFFFESPDVGAFLWALARENDGSFVGMSRP